MPGTRIVEASWTTEGGWDWSLTERNQMKFLNIIVGAVALAGCATNMQNPSRTVAQQKLDRSQCSTESTGSKVQECLAARGYSPLEAEPFPFDG
jgi:hypothetical protein